jgi:hypothetical protein
MLDKASGNSGESGTTTPIDSAPTPVKKVEEHNEAAIESIIQDDDDDLPF